jgi:glyoxylase-like metal-dependent hydrolase (beta-lactamase superfamily II)
VVSGDDWRLEAVATPGHSSDHLAFALAGSGILFSGDHVMGWSTTVVAPPDGSMTDYMASLDRLLARDEETYLPGHGGPIRKARSHVRALKAHRRAREAAILQRLAAGDTTIPAIVAAVYPGLAAPLVPAAALSVLAHLEDLVARGAAATAGGVPALSATFRISSRR